MALRPLLRTLLRSPALALGVAATLAVGVGALTATFAVVNAALLRQPPFPDAERLAVLRLGRNPIGEAPREEGWSYPRWQLLRARQRSFERVANYTAPSLTLSAGADGGDAELVRAEVVSADYLPILRVAPARGRAFLEAEDDPAAPTPVALVSHGLWTRRWAADPSAVGRRIRLNGEMLTVLGVLPEGFRGLSGRADVWVPTAMASRLTYAQYVTTDQNFINAVGRLRDGVSLDAARAELAVLGATINRALPSDAGQPEERVRGVATPINEARADRTVRRSLVILLGAVGLLHLLACANVTNLLLGRAATRRRETAVRAALGGGGARLFRHLLGEHLALAAPGALAGVLLAWGGTALVAPPTAAWAPTSRVVVAPFDAPTFGARELAFALALAAATALLVALPPALSAFRLDVQAEIRSGARGLAGGAMRLARPTPRGVLVALEATLAVLLVVGAGLLVDSFRRVRAMPLGAGTANVLTFWVVPSESRVPPARAPEYVGRLLDAMARVPGVVSASVDGGAPLAGTAVGVLYVAGRPVPPEHEAPRVLRHYVGPDHFRTLGIPLRRGRGFGAADAAGAPRVTVISEGAARRFWPGEDPIGKRVWFGSPSGADSSAEIVGVVGDVMYEPLDRQPNRASFYTPYTQFTYASRMVFLRTAGDPRSVVPAARRALREVDPDVAMRDVQTLDDIVHGSRARHRSGAFLFGAFGVAALLLAASGVFAVVAYAVASRTREFGVRIALGAGRGRVVRLVLGEGLAFPALGLVVGVAAAAAGSRLLRSALYEVSPLEPRVFAATVALLLGAAVAACAVPAWRATRADPMEAMRSE